MPLWSKVECAQSPGNVRTKLHLTVWLGRYGRRLRGLFVQQAIKRLTADSKFPADGSDRLPCINLCPNLGYRISHRRRDVQVLGWVFLDQVVHYCAHYIVDVIAVPTQPQRGADGEFVGELIDTELS